ncbi:MAG TPA: hypothetical protein PK289_08895 [Bacteroidia bacterium]|jgi:hypothetical protein|nr:hypothetical protein [Bacteroidia bacterium]HRG52496.1 hypothetical protein [Bacteroidia bacterium]
MASKRDIKRTINNVIGNFLDDCYSDMLNNPGKHDTEIEKIVDDAVDLADDLIARVNKSKTVEVKGRKAHFNEINKQLKEKTIGLLKKLDTL